MTKPVELTSVDFAAYAIRDIIDFTNRQGIFRKASMSVWQRDLRAYLQQRNKKEPA